MFWLAPSWLTPSKLLFISSLWWNQESAAHQMARAIEQAIIAHIPCCEKMSIQALKTDTSFELGNTYVEPGGH